MNRNYARKLADTITNEELCTMFDNAKNGITDWTEVSSVNKSMTKGATWNVFAYNFNLDSEYHVLAKTNMIREFGDFLPEHLKLKPKSKRLVIKPFHQQPIF